MFFKTEYIINDAKHAVVDPPCANIIAIILHIDTKQNENNRFKINLP